MAAEIKTILTLDDVDFKKKLSDNEKSVLKFSAATATIAAAAGAAAIATASWQDQTGKLAQSAGVAASTFSKLSIAAEKSNVSQQDLAATLAKISTASPELATRLNKIGISYNDASGKAKTSAEVFGDVADKVAKAGTTAEKSAIAVRAFGDEGAKLVPMLVGGKKALADAAAEAEKYGLVVSEEAGQAAALFNDQLAESKNAIKGLISSLGESVIAWSNQGGVMDMVRNGIAAITQLWRGLDSETKNIIITIGAVAAGLGAVATAMIAIKAIAPSVGSALSKMFGPVGLIIQGVVAAVAAISIGFSKYGHTLENFTTPANKALEKSLQNVSATMVRFPRTAEEAAAGFGKLATGAEKVERPISLIGTSVAWITKQLAKGQVTWGAAFERLALELQVLTDKFKEVKDAASALLSGNMSAYGQSMRRYALLDQKLQDERVRITAQALETIGKLESQSAIRYKDQAKSTVATAKKVAEEVRGANDKTYTAQFANPVLAAYRDIGLAALKMKGATAKEIEDYNKETGGMQAATTTAATQMAIGYAKMAESAVNAVGPAINAATMVTDAMSKATQYAAKVSARDLEVVGLRAQRAYEEQKAALEASNAAQIADINATYDAKIAAVTNGEAAITAAIELERNQRLLADDAEYQAAVEKLRLQYEAKLALIDQNSIDVEQRRLNDAVAEQSFQAQLAALATEFAGKKDKTTKDVDAKASAQKKLSDEQIKKLEADKNAELERAKIEADAKMKALDLKKAADDKALEKQKLQTQYDAEVQEFNQTKAVKSVQTIASGIAAAAGAFAATAGALPFGLGIPIGLAIAGTILGATYASVSQINSQQPVKPAALIAATGGKITTGQTHHGANGGVDVKAEVGETILSRGLTNKVEAFVDDSAGGQNIYFQDGAFRMLQLDRDLIQELARAVGDEIRREGLALG